MMKYSLLLGFFTLTLFAEINNFEGTTPLGTHAPIKEAWTLKDGIDTPESAYWDAGTKALYVSNIAGEGTGKDGRGWISKISLDGKVISKEWAKGFDAPKGLRAYKSTLWISDIDRVHSISLKDGKTLSTLTIPGAKFLNDVAVDDSGTVYVSDTIGTKIYAIHNGKAEVFAEGPELESPNGLLVEGGTLFVGGWGLAAPDFSAKIPGRLYSLDLKTKKKSLITPAPFANFDGLERAKNGFWVTDWAAGKVFVISNDGKSTLLVDGLKGSADIAYVDSKQLLVVPCMKESTVRAYDVSKLKL